MPVQTLDEARQVVRPNPALEAMKSGQICAAFGLTMCFNPEMALMAARTGYSALLLNLEHTKVSLETASAIACACLNVGVAPILVVPSLQSDWISRGLDCGAQGIIVPRVETVEEVRTIVRFAKHRPLGERPLAAPPQQQYAPIKPSLAMQVANETCMAIPMIETVKGLENCEELAKVRGVDMLFVGTFDLSDDMGITAEYDDERVMNGLKRIAKAAKAASTPEHKVFVGLGGLEPRPDIIRKLASEFDNIRFILDGRDSVMLYNSMQSQALSLAKLSADLQ